MQLTRLFQFIKYYALYKPKASLRETTAAAFWLLSMATEMEISDVVML